MNKTINPPDWMRPSGYSNAVSAQGRMIFVAGQIGWNSDQVFETDDFAGQVRQTLRNIVEVLAAADAKPAHIVRLTWYVLDKTCYLDNLNAIGAAYREVVGKCYPAMALVQVAGLLEDRAQVEIEATAVVPGF